MAANMNTLSHSVRASESEKEADFENLKRAIHTKLVDKLDLTRVGELEGDVLRREIRMVVEHLCDSEDALLDWARYCSNAPRRAVRFSFTASLAGAAASPPVPGSAF